MRLWKAGMLTLWLSMTMGCASVFGQSATEYFEDDAQLALALARAAAAGDETAMAEALERGADPNKVGRHSMTPIFWVINMQPNPEALEYLLAHGGDPDLGAPNPQYPEIDKVYPIEQAFKHTDPRFLKILLEAGADPNMPVSGEDNTLLYEYQMDELRDRLQMLIEYGADVNYQNEEYGSVPLRRMITAHYFQAATMLVKAGADPTIENRFGKAPLDYIDTVSESPLAHNNENGNHWEELIEALKSRGYLDDSY